MKNNLYQIAVRILLYTMIRARQDLAYSIGVVCRFMSKHRQHWQMMKWTLKYMNGSLKRKMSYKKEEEEDFVIIG